MRFVFCSFGAIALAVLAATASATIADSQSGQRPYAPLRLAGPRRLATMPPPEASQRMADLVVVVKSDRQLYLYANGVVVAQYPIALGRAPVGTKHRRGDNRTPLGGYTLDWRNPESIFHRSIHISYPKPGQVAAAKARGINPGDNIMIHGQPDYDDRKRAGDWTHGCIAVSNAAIDDIWQRVADGTPIEIYR